VTFEFLIIYRNGPETDILAILCNVLEDILIGEEEFNDEDLQRMIVPNLQRSGIEVVDEYGPLPTICY
jgi:hypothetical protein